MSADIQQQFEKRFPIPRGTVLQRDGAYATPDGISRLNAESENAALYQERWIAWQASRENDITLLRKKRKEIHRYLMESEPGSKRAKELVANIDGIEMSLAALKATP